MNERESLIKQLLNRGALAAAGATGTEDSLSIFGKAPDIALKLPPMPTLQQQIFNITMSPVLSDEEKRLSVVKLLKEEEGQSPGYSTLAAALVGGGGFLGVKKILEATPFFKKRPPKTVPAVPMAGTAVMPSGKGHILKDLLKYVGSAYIGLALARMLSRKSGVVDLRTPIEASKINIWNLMNR